MPSADHASARAVVSRCWMNTIKIRKRLAEVESQIQLQQAAPSLLRGVQSSHLNLKLHVLEENTRARRQHLVENRLVIPRRARGERKHWLRCHAIAEQDLLQSASPSGTLPART